jgi:hypothetical protein
VKRLSETMGGCSRWLQQVDRLLAAAGRWGRAIAGYGLWRRGGGRCRRARRWARCSFDGDDGGGRGRRLRLRGLVGGGGMALNGEEGRRRVNNERVERCAAASETSLEMYVRVGVTEWKVETRRRAHEVGGRGSEHEEGPRHRFRVLLLHRFLGLCLGVWGGSACRVARDLSRGTPQTFHRFSARPSRAFHVSQVAWAGVRTHWHPHIRW